MASLTPTTLLFALLLMTQTALARDALELVDFEEIEPGLASGGHFGNIHVVDTKEGLVLIDAGLNQVPKRVLLQLASIGYTKHFHTVIYTHGHVDHVGIVPTLDEYNSARGFPRVQVVAHERVVDRFDRYKKTNGYNTYINQRQFQNENSTFPSEFRYPDLTYSDELKLEIGGKHFHCFHAIGETDDATWVYIPEHDAVATGDFVIGASPNSGNPQKVQRYSLEWAAALRRMIYLEPYRLLPGHGPLYEGKMIIRTVLEDAAKLLEIIHAQVLSGLNNGKTKNQIVHSMVYPEELLAKPYLMPVYDDPEFIVHNIWRQYAGWWDQNPSHLREPEDGAAAVAVCNLGGGVLSVANKAQRYADDGELRIASYLIEHAQKAVVVLEKQPTVRRKVETIRSHIYGLMEANETSLMGQSIFKAAKADSDKWLAENSA